MPSYVTVDNQQVLIGLGQFKAAATDRAALLEICGNLMRDSIARTFREEGSPAGSWPKLAISTLKHKGYTTGHKLLVLSARLFLSFTYVVQGDTLTVGTNVPYAAVHQYGSRDWMGGMAGPRIAAMMTAIKAHSRSYLHAVRYQMRSGVNSRGQAYSVPVPMTRGEAKRMKGQSSYIQGPRQLTHHEVEEHTRRQNIPARPFLVFRPEDPTRFTEGIERFLAGKAMRIGKVGGAA